MQRYKEYLEYPKEFHRIFYFATMFNFWGVYYPDELFTKLYTLDCGRKIGGETEKRANSVQVKNAPFSIC